MTNRTDARKTRGTRSFLTAKTLVLAGFALLLILGISSLALYTRTAAMHELEKNMPTLSGDPAVEYLKKDAAFGSLAEAISKATLDDNPEAQIKLTANDSAARTYFGRSVSVSGDTVIVGAPANSFALPISQGAAYIFLRSGSTWTLQQKLTAPDTTSGTRDAFGLSVAITGNTVIVGAPSQADVGAAYVFIRNGTAWTPQKKFTQADDPTSGANSSFGRSVAISGETVVIGSAGNNTGFAHVFVRDITTWTRQATLTSGQSGSHNRLFGNSVAISGDAAVVGNANDNIGANMSQGSAFIFFRCGTMWTRQQKLTAGDGSEFDLFGTSVAIAAGTVIIGSPGDQVGSNAGQGSAYTFVYNDPSWTQQQKLVAGDGIRFMAFGSAVTILGNTAVIGSPSGDSFTQNPGSAYVFVRNGTTWTFDERIRASDGLAFDAFGTSLAISSEFLVTGAPQDGIGANAEQGSAYVNDRAATSGGPAGPTCEIEIEVNITTDQADANLTDDVCDVDTGQSGQQCSLRAAIQTANEKEGPDEILFDIPGGGVRTINVVTFGLPEVTETTSIDGTTQPGYTNNLPVIEIRGDHSNTGLRFMAGSAGSVLKGVTINGFAFEGVFIETADNRLENCMIGLLADGQTVDPNQTQSVGIKVRGPRNTIGGIRANGKPVNIISGNFSAQIEISASFATDNIITGNSIGYFANGDVVTEEAGFGIRVTEFARRTTIGGTAAGTQNLVTAKDTVAILIHERSSDNKILRNEISHSDIGIRVVDSDNNTIGGERGVGSETSTNIIWGTELGIYIGYDIEKELNDRGRFRVKRLSGMKISRESEGTPETVNNKVFGNDIGTCGNSSAGNGRGILVAFATNTQIGDVGDLGNCISGNSIEGVNLDTDSVGTIAKGNKVGVNFAGNLAQANDVGMFIAGSNNQILDNVIAGNTRTGILIQRFDDSYPVPTGNTVQANFIGTTPGHSLSLGNGESGVSVQGDDNTVSDNLISGNISYGVDILGDDNQILNNKIGTDISGSSGIPNGEAGILVVGSDNRLAGNVVSGNQLAGISISRDPDRPEIFANGNTVQGNYIGTNASGTAALSGQQVGIAIANGASMNRIGGSEASSKNVISGNTLAGVLIQPGPSAGATTPTANRIQGNYIGTNSAGTTAIPNGFDGIQIDGGSQTLVGGFGTDMPGVRNIISGNGRDGIRLLRGALLNRVSGNYIGTQADGTSTLGNVERGIRVGDSVSGTIIGGPEVNAGNTIAFNGSNGISLTNDAGNNNIIDPNRIFGNVLAGIDIGENGFTPNDPADADVGPNKLQNYPTMTLSISGGNLIVSYQIDSAPQHSTYGGTGIYVEFFEADATGAGQHFLGFDYYLLSDYTNGTPGMRVKNLGNAVALGIVAGDKLTATATDAEGNSSEFTPAVNAPGGAPGFEGDVAPRPDGDGVMLSTDITQLRRFVSGLDVPGTTTNEIQRADCAPRSTFGDGLLTSTDVVQGRRYVAGLDPSTPSGGPASRVSIPEAFSTSVASDGIFSSAREMRVGQSTVQPGPKVSVPIEMTSNGNETAMSFTIEYDASMLTTPRVNLAKFAPPGSTLTVNTNEPGRIGILIDSNQPMTASAIARSIVLVTFDVHSDLSSVSSISLNSNLSVQGVSDGRANSLPTTYHNGVVRSAAEANR